MPASTHSGSNGGDTALTEKMTAASYRLVSSAGRIDWQFGQASTRPLRGRVDVKFTWSRKRRTAFNVAMVSRQYGHLTGVSSR